MLSKKNSNWELAKHIDNKRFICKKHRTMLNFDDHLSAQPAANSNADSLGMKKASKRKGGHSQTNIKMVSNLCCALRALNTISIWETNKDLIEHMNNVHPLTNLNEISFNQMHHVPAVFSLLDYHNISAAANYASINASSLLVLTSCLPGSYYIQLNVNPYADLIRHVVAIHIKCHWSKLSLPTDTEAIIADSTMVIGKIQKMDVKEAIAIDSGVKRFQKFLGPTPISIVLIHRMYPRIQRNSTRAKAHLIANKLINKRATRCSPRTL